MPIHFRIKYNPGFKDVTKIPRKYDVSEDKLTLKIKKVTEDLLGKTMLNGKQFFEH